MNSIVEANVRSYLVNELRYRLYDTGTILDQMRSLASMAGHDLDERFAYAGLGAGPEARIASRLVDYALVGGGGTETPETAIRKQIDEWLRRNPRRWLL